MDDATKTAAAAAIRINEDSESSSVKSTDAFVAYMDDSTAKVESKGEQTQERLTTSAKALDRWFKDRQKTNGAPRLLESARGYRATLVAGQVTARDGVDTGARPGGLVRN